MGRWAYLDSDEERLPEGMRRVAYDAATQTYTYEDADGAKWQGVPGARYGQLHRVEQQAPPLPVFESDEKDKEIAGDEPEYVLRDGDDSEDKGGRGDNRTFEAILGGRTTTGPVAETTEPKRAYLRRWNSLSRAATKFIPRLPPLPLPGDAKGEGEGQSQGEKARLPSSMPRRRASTISAITRGWLGG
ncbi:hypothetical protein B0T16DRAFT_129086 [Cercophora newfieldiana]|uniref:Uncharacterized protein n=1 Tax=Cercophora newfieldiana TaxID=92897 RepID=A0AA40CS26_9PEZI|nr:hypothetical protein B0T16DRAFT_129086 [Cercophora newfieldiana]